MTMTLRQFFERLPKDGWFLERGRYVRRIEDRQCPLCAASKEPRIRVEWAHACDILGMSCILGQRIAAAADGYEDKASIRLLRRLLLKHCGLTEPTP